MCKLKWPCKGTTVGRAKCETRPDKAPGVLRKSRCAGDLNELRDDEGALGHSLDLTDEGREEGDEHPDLRG